MRDPIVDFPEESLFPTPAVRGIAYLVSGAFLLITCYLWYIQVVRGEEYLEMARSNRVRLVRRPSPRGLIYDRLGGLVADNRASFDVEVVPEDVEDMELVEERLGGILGLDPREVRARIRAGRSYSYLPVTVEGDVGMEVMLEIEERRPGLAGVRVGVYPRRRYLQGPALSHVLGYLGVISPGELDRLRERGYTRQDLVGKNGVEKQYEEFLAGRAGSEGIQVDNRGYLDRVLYRQEPVPGSSLYLTVDMKTQRAAEAVLAENTGAVTALDPGTGEVLAMASSPGYDPNGFVPPVESDLVRGLMASPDHPLINRAIQGAYAPGSTFKPYVAFAALESGAITGDTPFVCTGVFMLGKHPYKCWYPKGHGRLTLADALMFSCNVFFYNTGYRTGRDEIVRVASAFGLAEPTGIDLPGERAGLVPTAAWREERGMRTWNPGDTVVMAIGQGYLALTPLRAATAMAAIANGGKLYRPYLVKQIVSPLGETVESRGPELVREIPLRAGDLALVREGLRRVVNSKYGTGQKGRLEGIEIAGKTGTVQVGVEGQRKNHAWFTGYAPADNPQIAVAVLLEGRESGGFFAAPAAKKIFAAYFNIDLKE
ncbi:MAG: penicillin-binding protein 2 [Chlamydiota bacterium]